MSREYKRTILITGATDGIGRQTALDLAAHPDNFVIIHGRTEQKCILTKETIHKENGDSSNVDYVSANFCSLKEVSAMADEVKRRFPRLNVLLCNTGVLNSRRLETKDGFEATFQINYLSHFLLCSLLIPLLSRSQSNVIIVGSVLHTWPSLDWSDIMAEKDYEKYLQYSRSKLMCHLMAFALHRRMNIAHKTINVNVIELGKEKEPNNNGKLRTTSALSSSMSTLSICRQAGNLAQLIEGPILEKVSGKYLDPSGKQLRSGSDATDERLQERLWAYSQDLCSSFLS
ncbi:unnamed protein product [Caenorhabditis bovis]|uniref:Uncharacterized protein n=1 Tax=Caenorhabditis bovis TaxID=2654633 RepID=A0A8S1E7D0_9PELO|nr:unnamed protein product [Caenorhabditis bovis]